MLKPQSPSLTSLKSKKVTAQKELDSLLLVIDNKRSILDRLLADIKDANKTIDDDFSQKRLILEREAKEHSQILAGDIADIQESMILLETQQKNQSETNTKLQQDYSDLKLAIIEAARKLREITTEYDSKKHYIVKLRADETALNNRIDELKITHKELDEQLSVSIIRNDSAASDMRVSFNREREKLEYQISDKKAELLHLQQDIITHHSKKEALIEEQKQAEVELIQRENILVIKTKALAREQAEFNTETRRWNYIRPLPE